MRRFYTLGDWSFGFEASRPRPEIVAGFWLDPEDGVVLYTRCPWWFSLRVTPPWSLRRHLPEERRNTSACFGWDGDAGGSALGVSVNVNRSDSWSREQDSWPLWKRVLRGNGLCGNFDVLDFVLGKAVYEKLEYGVAPVSVEMPEGFYGGLVTIERVRWKRPRWYSRWYWRNNIDIAEGLPFPGKGESAHDCEDDAMYGATFSITREPENAVDTARRAAEGALKTRSQRGGLGWVPDKGWSPNVVPHGAKS